MPDAELTTEEATKVSKAAKVKIDQVRTQYDIDNERTLGAAKGDPDLLMDADLLRKQAGVMKGQAQVLNDKMVADKQALDAARNTLLADAQVYVAGLKGNDNPDQNAKDAQELANKRFQAIVDANRNPETGVLNVAAVVTAANDAGTQLRTDGEQLSAVRQTETQLPTLERSDSVKARAQGVVEEAAAQQIAGDRTGVGTMIAEKNTRIDKLNGLEEKLKEYAKEKKALLERVDSKAAERFDEKKFVDEAMKSTAGKSDEQIDKLADLAVKKTEKAVQDREGLEAADKSAGKAAAAKTEAEVSLKKNGAEVAGVAFKEAGESAVANEEAWKKKAMAVMDELKKTSKEMGVEFKSEVPDGVRPPSVSGGKAAGGDMTPP